MKALPRNKELGFTLVEMLVSLMVLSFAAIAIGISMTSAFDAYSRLKSTSKDMQAQTQLRRILTEVSIGGYIEHSDIGNEPEVYFQGHRLKTLEDGQIYKLVLEKEDEVKTLWEDAEMLRLNMGTHSDNDARSKPNSASRGFLALQRRSNLSWEDIIVMPLKVTAPALCQFDVVSRDCR